MVRKRVLLNDELELEELEELVRKRLTQKASEIELWRRTIRHYARNDTWFLGKYLLGYEELSADFHLKMCKRLAKWPKHPRTRKPLRYTMDMWPRGGFKTTLCTITRGIQTVLRVPEETIRINHGEADKAALILSQIKGKLETCHVLRWAFDDIVPKDPMNYRSRGNVVWKADAITLIRRGVYSEATFTIGSPQSEDTGGHFTYIINDDLVTRKNHTTELSRKKVEDFFLYTLFLRDRRTISKGDSLWQPWMPNVVTCPFRMSIVCTPWHIDDVNCKIARGAIPGFEDDVDLFIQDAEVSNGVSFFPERFPWDELKVMEKKLTPAVYACLMRQQPQLTYQSVFSKEHFRYWRNGQLPKVMNVYMAVDCNNKSDDPNSDWGVSMVIGMDAMRNVYILAISRDHFTIASHTRENVNLIGAYKPKLCGIDAHNFQNQMVEHLKESLKYAHPDSRCHIVPINVSGRAAASKDERIVAMQGLFEDGRIHINLNEPNHSAFVRECIMYRPSKERSRLKRDMLDTLEMCLRIAHPPTLERHYAENDRSGQKRVVKTKPRTRTAHGRLGKELMSSIGVIMDDEEESYEMDTRDRS